MTSKQRSGLERVKRLRKWIPGTGARLELDPDGKFCRVGLDVHPGSFAETEELRKFGADYREYLRDAWSSGRIHKRTFIRSHLPRAGNCYTHVLVLREDCQPWLDRLRALAHANRPSSFLPAPPEESAE